MVLDLDFVIVFTIIAAAFTYLVYDLGYKDGRKDGIEDAMARVKMDEIRNRREERVNFIDVD